MGRGVAQCIVGVPNNSEEVHRRNPFSLTYGVEAVILTKINLCSAQVSGFDPAQNSEVMLKQLNLLEEHRELATIGLAEYQ